MRAYDISRIFRDVMVTIPGLESYVYEDKCGFRDYQNGLYFERDWFLNGADPNLIGAKTLPSLEVKEESVTYEDGCLCRRFQLTVRVEDCMDCETPPDAVSLAGKFIDEVLRLERYDVDGEYYWLTPERAQGLRQMGNAVLPTNYANFPVRFTRRKTIGKPVQDAARFELIVCSTDSVESDNHFPLTSPSQTSTC